MASPACGKVTKVGQEAPPLGPIGHEKWSQILDQALSLIPVPQPQGKANQVEGCGGKSTPGGGTIGVEILLWEVVGRPVPAFCPRLLSEPGQVTLLPPGSCPHL